MVHLDYRDARPIYAQITDGIREQIAAGILEPGEKLPSVREMAAELAINPNTIQRSYRILELDGWIATVPGKGCFVSGSPQTRQNEQRRLLAQLDELKDQLCSMGLTLEQIIDYLRGGNDHA